MAKFLISDTITEFRTYEVQADSYETAAALVDQHATDRPEDLTGGLVLVNRGITDRFQQDETPRASGTACSCGHSEAYHNLPFAGLEQPGDKASTETGCMLCFKANICRPYSVSQPAHEFASVN